MKRILLALLCLPLAAGESWYPAADKRGHFLGGFLIGATVTVGFRWGGGTPKQSARIGFMVGTAEGIRKEWLDNYANGLIPTPRHDASPADAAYTIAGAALGSWLTYEVLK